MRGDKTFAYDLNVAPGRVNSRVALLLRSIERKPACPSFVRLHSPIIHSGESGGTKGDGNMGRPMGWPLLLQRRFCRVGKM